MKYYNVNGFDDSNQRYLLKIKQFLSKDYLDSLSKLNQKELSEWITKLKENYAILSKTAQYEYESYYNGYKINIFLDKKGDKFVVTEKQFAKFFIEQVFSKNNDLIVETIKEMDSYKN